MIQIALTIVDSRRAIHDQPPAGFADSVIAALSSDPETIEELEVALARFRATPLDYSFFAGWLTGLSDEPFDAGVCVIDLAARLVAIRSTYSTASHRGEVQYHDGQRYSGDWLPFDIAQEWQFCRDVDRWRAVAQQRRRERLAIPRIDFRAVLFGPPLIDYVVRECSTAKEESRQRPLVDIHARWLLTPRGDLGFKSPRDWLLSAREHLDTDLQWRDQQWSLQGRCPPPLARSSVAYRYGGSGTHEIVLYYDLVRYQLTECWERTQREPELSAADETLRLTRLRDDWLVTAQDDDLHGKSPQQVIDDERRRIPQIISGHDAMVDHDCPLCAMMAEMPGPLFWQLDGSHMEDDFAFSFCQTREQWIQEQRYWGRYRRERGEEIQATERYFTLSSPTSHDCSPHNAPNSDAGGAMTDMAVQVLLHSIAAHVGELIEECRQLSDGTAWTEQLQRDYDNVTAVVRGGVDAIVSGVVMKAQGTLADLGDEHSELGDKCDELIDRLGELAVRLAVPHA